MGREAIEMAFVVLVRLILRGARLCVLLILRPIWGYIGRRSDPGGGHGQSDSHHQHAGETPLGAVAEEFAVVPRAIAEVP